MSGVPPLQLQVLPLREHLLVTAEETVNQVLVALQPERQVDAGPTQSNIVLVLDDSGSMSGAPIAQVLDATRAIIGRLGPNDHLGIVAFADSAEVIHPIVNGAWKGSLLRSIDPWAWSHGRRGYGTNLSLGMQCGADELRRHAAARRVQRMIVLTDGFASNPELALRTAQTLSEDRISIVSLGFGGEFDMAFMDRIAGFSGGACEYIDPSNVHATIANFLDQLTRIRNQITDNARITLRFRGDHRVTDFYQTHPKVIYHGLARLDANRTWTHRLAEVERKAGLEMLFTIVHPREEVGRRLVADIEVRYDVPSAGLVDQVQRGRFIVEYGNDEAAFLAVDPRVQRRYNDAFVEKQQLRARQLIESGQNDEALRVLGTIRKRGDEPVRRLAEGTIRKLETSGQVEREDLFRLKMGTQKKARAPEAPEDGATEDDAQRG